jgi:hypothetical protein
MTSEQIESLKFLFCSLVPRPEKVVHGGAIGADEQFDDIMREWHIERLIFPSTLFTQWMPNRGGTWLKSKPPLVRNRSIVNASGIMLAAPSGPEVIRSGTWSTIRYAKHVGKPLFIFWPDGSTTRENC